MYFNSFHNLFSTDTLIYMLYEHIVIGNIIIIKIRYDVQSILISTVIEKHYVLLFNTFNSHCQIYRLE